MKEIEKLIERYVEEIKEYAKNVKDNTNIPAEDVKMVDTLAHASKNLIKVLEHFEEDDEGHSSLGYPMMRGASYRNDSGNMNRGGGNSYGRYGYSRPYEAMYYARGNRGYSRHDARDRMIEKLEDAMMGASSDAERETIRDCITQIEQY